MGKIKQLSKNLINQISAGEVIERPCSVVKELVENAIDAKSTRISIDITNECRNIRVADNGTGIEPDDIINAFSNHATSKIETESDLESIFTLGFRGEALASIISIAKLTCITRTKENDFGTKVECENSQANPVKTGCAVGTIMEVKDLFYNTPVRLKFLKSAKTEFSYISDLVCSLCISHPEIAFTLTNNGKLSFKTSGSGDLNNVIKELFGADILKNLYEVSKVDELSNIKVTGYVSSPDYVRASKKDYYLFVNSRIVKCPVIQKSIDTAYKFLTGKYPFIILNLEIPPTDIDVNVHPSKREIRYKNPNQIFSFIYSATKEALNVVPAYLDNKVDFVHSKEESIEVPQNENNKLSFDFSIQKTQVSYQNDEMRHSYDKVSVDNNSYQIKQNAPIQQQMVPVSAEKEDLIIGQYAKTYILIEQKEGLEIVDQHIADERYIYEQLKMSKQTASQLLFISDVISLNEKDFILIKENKEKFEKFGFEIELINKNELIFRKVPQLLSKINPKEILTDILANYETGENDLEEKILITTACKSAVKANTPLNLFQMQEIIKKWRKCQNPKTCPHGRPISRIIPHKEIANYFERNK